MAKDDSQNKLTAAFLTCKAVLSRYMATFFVRPEDIEDTVQEAYLKALQAQKDTEILAPRAYLFRVARNIAINKKLRQRKNFEESVGIFDDSIALDDRPGPDEQDNITSEGRLNFASDASAWEAMLGVSAIQDKRDLNLYYVANNTTTYTGGLYEGSTDTLTLSVFGEATYSVSDQLRLTFGGRVENEDQQRDALWLGLYQGLQDDEKNSTVVLPKVGVSYDLNAATVIAFDVRYGYTPSGIG